MIPTWAFPVYAALLMAALFAADRHERRQKAADQLRQVRTRIRRPMRAEINAKVTRMCDWDIAQEVAGICRATAAAEGTTNPATKE